MRGVVTYPVCRAMLAVLALYGMLLQPFVAAASPTVLLPDGVHCTPAGDAKPGEAPDRHAHQCCTAAKLGNPFLPATAGSVVVEWPAESSVRVTYARHEAAQFATGPPVHAHSPRGPPSV